LSTDKYLCWQGLKGVSGDKGSSVYLSENGVSAGLIEGPPGPRGAIGLPGEKVGYSVFIARQQRSMLMRDIDIANLSVCPSVCLSVRPSVTFRYQMKTA